MAEGYIRPPLVGAEPGSDRAAEWRFRTILIVAFLALAFGAFLLVHWIVSSHNNEGSPSVGARAAAVAPRR